MLRCLNNAHIRLVKKSEGFPENATVRDEIRIEQKHELRPASFTKRLSEPVVDVARLGVLAVLAAHVFDAQSLGDFSDPLPRTIIKHPYTQVGMLDRLCAYDGSFQNLQGFVVGRDENIHWLRVQG